MTKVYKHRRLARDEYLGRIDVEGRVYETRFGPDQLIGRVEFNSGKVYEARLGPDQYIGRVDLESGKIFLSRFGPDEYLGRVKKNGKLYHHQRLALDDYLGRVADMPSFAHGGAAFLLLILPELEKDQAEKDIKNEAQAQPKKTKPKDQED